MISQDTDRDIDRLKREFEDKRLKEILLHGWPHPHHLTEKESSKEMSDLLFLVSILSGKMREGVIAGFEPEVRQEVFQAIRSFKRSLRHWILPKYTFCPKCKAFRIWHNDHCWDCGVTLVEGPVNAVQPKD